MRLIFLTFMVCADTRAADSRSTNEPVTMSDVRSGPKTAKSKRTFHPLRLLRRLGNAESEFGLRLSSWGTQQKGSSNPPISFYRSCGNSQDCGNLFFRSPGKKP